VAFEALRREQAQWLKEVTALPEFRDAPYRVVFCHIPLRWTNEAPALYQQGGYDAFSRVSRDLWHDALAAWKAQVVISGHTHQAAYLPGMGNFPMPSWLAAAPSL
jgi:hypothetical protein